MLDPDDVDLDDLAQARDDHDAGAWSHSWWFDPRSGAVHLHTDESDRPVDELDDDAMVIIEAQPSSADYGDMADFVELVADRRTGALLARAIEGRGAFRRFKDALFDFPDLREEWFAFRDTRGRRRAIDWLEEHDLVSPERGRAAKAQLPDPPVGGVAARLPGAVARDLRELYGDRVHDVLVFGSRARGDADGDADLDLLVVLDTVDDPWAEHRRMEDVLWRHTTASGIVVTALPVGRSRYEAPDDPVLIRARAEAVPA